MLETSTQTIYLGQDSTSIQPEDGVCVYLDAKMHSSLDWKENLHQARKWISEGHFILWEMDFGLFDGLLLPLEDEGQYLSLSLALDHFKQTVWPEFKERSLGMILYRGPLNFSVKWDEFTQDEFKKWLGSLEDTEMYRQLYSRKIALDYLRLLAALLPDELEPYLLLNGEGISSVEVFFRLAAPDVFSPYHIGMKSHWMHTYPLALPYAVWDKERLYNKNTFRTCNWAICLPPSDQLNNEAMWSMLESTLRTLPFSFKFVSEELLTEQWHGLDNLLVFSQTISPQGKRKLLGFCAAGGTVVTLGESLCLPQEISLQEFIVDYISNDTD